MAKTPPYVYGQSPAPKSWHETSVILKDRKPKKKKSSGFYEKIEKLLNERKG